MDNSKSISGFSKLSKTGKLKWLADNFFTDPAKAINELKDYWYHSEDRQDVLDGFSENTISNFPMPYSVAPNFLIDGKTYVVPMVIEESSVVAAASAAAKYWMTRGGFKTEIVGTEKVGQLHLKYLGNANVLKYNFAEIRKLCIDNCNDLTQKMTERGGGIKAIDLLDMTDKEVGYFQVFVTFETCDSMGANFINSILERFGDTIEQYLLVHPGLNDEDRDIQVVMAILSNYTPSCVVRASVSCKIDELGAFTNGMSAEHFAQKFALAVRIAKLDPYRAATHNKGIFNGVDAVVLATGNDFRAIEAGGHTYACRNGQYQSLSNCIVSNGEFRFWVELPIAVGTVGGLTKLHPIAKTSLEMLGNPSATELMRIIASVGLAQNFAAVRSLVTTGIQHGHMKMHLQNILIQLGATPQQIVQANEYFSDKVVSFSGVRQYLETLGND